MNLVEATIQALTGKKLTEAPVLKNNVEIKKEETVLRPVKLVKTECDNTEKKEESKKVVESISLEGIADCRELHDKNAGQDDLIDIYFFDHKLTDKENNDIAEAIEKAKSEIDDYDSDTIREYINKVVPIKVALSDIYHSIAPLANIAIYY